MVNREKLLAGLECHSSDSDGTCQKCPYSSKNFCSWELTADALAALREDAEEIEQLKAQAYNLNLYLAEVFVHTGLYAETEKRHPGLPGYEGSAVALKMIEEARQADAEGSVVALKMIEEARQADAEGGKKP